MCNTYTTLIGRSKRIFQIKFERIYQAIRLVLTAPTYKLFIFVFLLRRQVLPPVNERTDNRRVCVCVGVVERTRESKATRQDRVFRRNFNHRL